MTNASKIQGLFLSLLILLSGCSAENEKKPKNRQEIAGRDEAPLTGVIRRYPIYRAVVPDHWKRIDPPLHHSIFDSTKALCEFSVTENGEEMQLYVHNFPTDSLEERVPPIAQIARWKRQLHPLTRISHKIPDEDGLKPESIQTVPESHGGFYGVYFEGNGNIEEKQIRIMAWAMQMDLELYQNLMREGSREMRRIDKQRRSDYTIKAVGSTILMEKEKENIHRFARSFELIQEVPDE